MENQPRNRQINTLLFSLVVVTFLTALYSKGLNSGIPLHYDDLGYSATVGGTFVAVFTLASTAMRLVGGQLTDRFSHFKVLIASLVGLLVGVLIPALWNSYVIDMVSRVIQGASFALATNVMTVAVMGSASKKHLGRRVGIKGAGTSLGTMLGALVATGLLEHLGYQAFYGFYALLMGAAILLVWGMHHRQKSWQDPSAQQGQDEVMSQSRPTDPHPTPSQETPQKGTSKNTRLHQLLAPYFIPGVVPYLAMSFARRLPKGFSIAFILVFSKHVGIASGPLFFVVAGATTLACRLLGGKLFDSQHTWWLMPLFCAQIVGFALLSLMPSFPLLMVAALGYGITVGMTSPFIKTLTAKCAPREHWGVVNGELYFFGDLGKALGAFLGGVLIDHMGKALIPQIALGFSVVAFLCVLMALLWSHKHSKVVKA